MQPLTDVLDPLSDVLSLLKPHTYVAGGFDVGGKLSIQFPRHDGIKCYAVVSGQCWLVVEGVHEPVRLAAGDCFLLPHGRPFCLATDLSTPPTDFRTLLACKPRLTDGRLAIINGGGECCIVGGHFAFTGGHARILLDVLPTIAHIRHESDKSAMRWSLERMRQELSDPRPGSFLVVQHLAHMMLVQALRLHIADASHTASESGPDNRVGWLSALADPQIGAAIQAMHSSPARHWTLQDLAEEAGMSRSSFAQRFKETVGSSPMEYLARWRMLVAADKLANTRNSISEIALSLGYESESAFSTAFKRTMGCSPRQYARGCPPTSKSVPQLTPQPELVAGY
ncbi:AraC family transcriptional regulator [Terracidiphilus gabretensis]|uniref:AraC family transcriptional regulator n=1 Tax=Terracidiphilus gabretensis TaxID=1577687 RepID=UPI00071B355A|nr:AraC family transcriptional regulator [Terracidiphilus gabretensis]